MKASISGSEAAALREFYYARANDLATRARGRARPVSFIALLGRPPRMQP